MVHTPIKGRAFESSGFQRWMISQNLAANLELMVEYYLYQAFCLIFIESKTRDEDTISCILYKPIFQRMSFLLQDMIGESMDDRLQL